MNCFPQSRYLATLYWHSDVVYLKARTDKLAGMVTTIYVRPGDQITYGVTWGSGTETFHYEMELTPEYVPDFVDANQ